MSWGLESVEHRVIGAIRFLDAETKLPVTSPLVVTPPAGVRIVRNPSGFHVLTDAPGFEKYVANFNAPGSEPEAESVTMELSVQDPSRRFVTRRFVVKVPRAAGEAVFLPMDVWMYPSPCARPGPGTALIRLSIEDANEAPIGGALVSISVPITDKKTLVERGISDDRGEVLVLVPGIPTVRWGGTNGDDLFHPEFSVTVEAALPEGNGLPNPDELFDKLVDVTNKLTKPLEITASKEVHSKLQLS